MKESELINIKQKSQTALDRLEALESSTVGLLKVVNKQFGRQDAQIAAVSEILNAVSDILGQETVTAKMTERATVALASDQKTIDAGLLEGRLAVGDVIDQGSIVGYKETLPNGIERPPGKFYRNMPAINEEAQVALAGKKVGDVADVGGTKVEVLEIYAIVPPAAPVATVPAAASVVQGEVTPSLENVQPAAPAPTEPAPAVAPALTVVPDLPN